MELGPGMGLGDRLQVDHRLVWAVSVWVVTVWADPDAPNQGGELGADLVHVSVGKGSGLPRCRLGAVRHPRGHLSSQHRAQFAQWCGAGFVIGALGIEKSDQLPSRLGDPAVRFARVLSDTRRGRLGKGADIGCHATSAGTRRRARVKRYCDGPALSHSTRRIRPERRPGSDNAAMVG